MTKLIAILSAVLFTAFSLTAASPAVRADEQEFFDLSGVVVEMNDEMILIEDADGSQVQVNLFEDTAFEGDAIVPGALIFVVYNGMMTRSLPPQVAAIKVSCFAFTGEIAEMNQNGFLLHPDEGMDAVQVNAPGELLEGLKPGSRVTVYFNGAMTMSLPGQIGAGLIVPAE